MGGFPSLNRWLGYDKWEDSALVTFSEFLGFSTGGFENETLDLLCKL